MARQPALQRTAAERDRCRVAALAALAFVCVWLGSFDGSAARANAQSGPGFLVIVNGSNAASEVTPELVAEAFLKKTTRWENGETIRPVDLAPNSTVRRLFSLSVLKRSVAGVRSYWQQRIFTGRGVPPPEFDTDQAVVGYVTKYQGAIGYVAPDTKLGNAKVLRLRTK